MPIKQSLPPAELLNPARYHGEIFRTSEYRAVRRDKENLGHLALTHAFSASASMLSHEKGRPHSEQLMYRVLSQLDGFAEAQSLLYSLREQHISPREHPEALEDVIAFNHSLKDVIDYNPSLTFADTMNFLTKMYVASHAGDENLQDEETRFLVIAWIQQQLRSVLTGMRHEIGVEQIVGHLGYDYKTSDTAEEEMAGIDITVDYHGTELALDIKSSQEAAERSRQHSHHPERIVWSQLSSEDFQGGFRATPQAVSEAAGYFDDQLAYAAQFAPQKRRRRA